MTTIVYDGKTVASDSKVVTGSMIMPGDYQKIHVSGNFIVGAAGCYQWLTKALKWVETISTASDPTCLGVDSDDDDAGGELLIVSCKTGEAWVISSDQPIQFLTNPPVAIGSGSCYAMGALFAGASAAEAIAIASKLDTNTGGTINIVVPSKKKIGIYHVDDKNLPQNRTR